MSFGSRTLTFVSLVGTGTYDDYGIEIVTESEVPVEGCHHRPLSAAEAAEAFGNVARQVWKSTCPPEAAVVAAKSTGRIKVDGQVFHIIGGATPFEDFNDPFKCTLMSELYPE
ncbi:hypothetical protein [Mycolicibacterium llatzerense]|uniref:hypothetical protein n=1 Tax=Mycolicibacterium llatzerense TaxID=280871 RepID=UPI0021B5CBE1|nr:hypothetical protein [Mycolicibacterium llatzerense]MCT7372938.1 hypothetical protein [Mycolicibacterium llatzerense]